MKSHLTAIVAAVLVVGCGNPQADRALLNAAKAENIYDVKRHLAAGADVNVKDMNGNTPLHSAAEKGHKEIAELLIAKGLLFKGADVNAKNDGGITPLHGAAIGGQKEIAELLIAKGATVNAKANDGRTPLDWSANGEIADLLRKHGGKSGEELKAEGK